MSQTADVVVIGGGVIGCSCAYFLARDGHRVILVERREIASGAASASGGWVVVQAMGSPDLVALARESLHWHKTLSADTGYRLWITGGLILAADHSDLQDLRQDAQGARQRGAPIEELDGQSLHELEPSIAPTVAGALYCSEEAVVDPPEVCRALADRSAALGASIWTGSAVTSIKVEGGRITGVSTPNGRIETPTVVCAAGAWSKTVGEMVGLEIPIVPRRGHLLLIEAELSIRRPMLEAGYLALRATEAPTDLRLQFVLQPRVGGGFLIGSSREFAGFDRTVNTDLVARIQARAAKFVPAVEKIAVAAVTVGFRPYTPLDRPIIDRAGPAGFIVASGHEGSGVTLAPLTGKVVSDLVAARRSYPEFELKHVVS